MSMADAAMGYAARGWPTVPVGGPKGKMPLLGKNWQNRLTCDEDAVAEMFERFPDATGLGVLCGEVSGIVDTGGNGPDSDALLAKIFGGEIPPTVSFYGNRGMHRWFKWRRGLPGKARCFYGAANDLELIAGNARAQVVVPPSRFGAITRTWVPGCSPDEIDLAEIPDEAVARFCNWEGMSLRDVLGSDEARSPEHWERIVGGVAEGGRNDALASFAGKVLRDLRDLSDVRVAKTQILMVNSQNRPPLPDKEVEATWLSVLRREIARREGEEMGQDLHLPTETVAKQDTALRGQYGEWRLVIVQSDPPAYQIHAPQFALRGNGHITVSADDMTSGNRIRVEALRQAGFPLPKWFAKKWDFSEKPEEGGKRKPSMYVSLVNNAETAPAPLEQHRNRNIAALAWEALDAARGLQEGEKPGDVDSPVRLEDGSVIFKFRPFQQNFSYGPEGIKQAELSAVLQDAGMETKNVRHKRMKTMSAEALKQLAGMIGETLIEREN